METALTIIKIEKNCLLCHNFSSCHNLRTIIEAAEMRTRPERIVALWEVMPEICGSLGKDKKYDEDQYLKSEKIEYGLLRRIAEAVLKNKKTVVAIGIISQNGSGSEILSAFVQGVYDSPEEAVAFTHDLNVVLLSFAKLSLVPAPQP